MGKRRRTKTKVKTNKGLHFATVRLNPISIDYTKVRNDTYAVVRGGSFNQSLMKAQVVTRMRGMHYGEGYDSGFRLVMDVPDNWSIS